MIWVYIVVAFVCSRLPLVNVLGYEAAAVFGVVSTTVVLCTVRLPETSGSLFVWWRTEFERQVKPLYAPVVVYFINSLFVQNCDWIGGLQFWIVIPILGVAIVLGLVAAVSQLTSMKVQGMVALLLIFDALFLLWRLAWWPPIAGFNLTIGWFAGSIYDEALTLPIQLIVYRITTCLIIVAGACILRRMKGEQDSETKFLLLCTILSLCVIFSIFSEPLLLKDDKWVKGELGASLESEHFIVYFDPDDIGASKEDVLLQDLEFRYHEMRQFFDEDPVKTVGRKIEVFIYPNAEEQQRLMGARNTFVARPWTHQMHLRWSFGSSALAHELSHLFSAPFGGWLLSLPVNQFGLPNIGLLEGVAVAADWPMEESNPHEVAAVLLEAGKLPAIENSFSPFGFWQSPSGRAYQSFGSFVRWLIDTYGMASMKMFYQGAEFYDIYGISVSESVQLWEQYLMGLEIKNIHKKQILNRYSRTSIFQKVCARKAADQQRIIRHHLKNRRTDEAISAITTLLEWREDPYFSCKKEEILFKNSGLEYGMKWSIPDMADRYSVYWMDLFLDVSQFTDQREAALSALESLDSWPISSRWRRRFLVKQALLSEGYSLDYFDSDKRLSERVEWLHTQYSKGRLYEYLLAINYSVMEQHQLVLRTNISSDWPVSLQANMFRIQLYSALQLRDCTAARELLTINQETRMGKEFEQRVHWLCSSF